MSMENIAIVFAPTLMRNPVMDPMAMFANTHSETTFIKILFSVLANTQGNELITTIVLPKKDTPESPTDKVNEEQLNEDKLKVDKNAIYNSVLSHAHPKETSREVTFSNLGEEPEESIVSSIQSDKKDDPEPIDSDDNSEESADG